MDVVSEATRAASDTILAQLFGMLKHHHTVSPLGNRCTSHDPCTLLWPQDILWYPPCSNNLNHFEFIAEIGSTAGKAIPGRFAEGRNVNIREDVLCKNAMEGIKQIDALRANPAT
jgi:hypothetical protein